MTAQAETPQDRKLLPVGARVRLTVDDLGKVGGGHWEAGTETEIIPNDQGDDGDVTDLGYDYRIALRGRMDIPLAVYAYEIEEY